MVVSSMMTTLAVSRASAASVMEPQRGQLNRCVVCAGCAMPTRFRLPRQCTIVPNTTQTRRPVCVLLCEFGGVFYRPLDGNGGRGSRTIRRQRRRRNRRDCILHRLALLFLLDRLRVDFILLFGIQGIPTS